MIVTLKNSAVYTQGNFLDPKGFNKQYPKSWALTDLISLKPEQFLKTESDMEHPSLKPWPLGYGQGSVGMHQPSQESIGLVIAHAMQLLSIMNIITEFLGCAKAPGNEIISVSHPIIDLFNTKLS